MSNIIWLFQLIWIIPRAHPLIWTPKQTSGCFGTGSSDFDFLKPECQPGEIIALKDFYAGSKSKSLSCPSESTDLNRNHSKCCTYAKDDCQFHLDGQGKGLWFYTNCTGRTDCTLRVDRVSAGRPCDFLTHLTPTNYMLMSYYCIPECLHQSVTDQSVFNGSTLYLYNNKYPEVIHLDLDNHTCSVSAPCGSVITVTAVDIRFQYNADGSCAQHLLLEDGEATQQIDCTFNNNFVVKSVFSSKGNFIKLTLNNSLHVPGGHFWIQLNTSDPRVEIEVSCGASAVSQPQPEHLCPYPTPTSDMARSLMPSASADVPHKAPPEDSSMHPATIAVIAVVGLCFLGLIFLVALYCIKKKKLMKAHQRGRSTEVRQNQDQPSIFRTVLCFCTDRNTSSTWASRTRDPPPVTSGEGKHDTSETVGPLSSTMSVPLRRSELPPLPEIPRIPPVDMSDNRLTPRLDPILLGQTPPNATTSTSAAPPKLPPIIPRASW